MSDIPVLTIDGEVIGCGRAEVKGSCGDAYNMMMSCSPVIIIFTYFFVHVYVNLEISACCQENRDFYLHFYLTFFISLICK